MARENAAKAGLANVQFHNSDEDPMPVDRSFDLTTVVDVMHDLQFPRQVLQDLRRAAKPDGAVLVVDMAQPDALEEKLNHPMASALYSFSIALCMSSGLSEEGGAGLGTFGSHESLLKEMAEKAGFTRFHRTDVTDRMNAYYVLRP